MSDEQPLGPLQLKWIDELRSGKNGQVIGIMGCSRGYCCLGLAAHKVLNMEPVVMKRADAPDTPPEDIEDIKEVDPNYWTYEAGQGEGGEEFYVFGDFTARPSGVSTIDPSIELVRWEELGLHSPSGHFSNPLDGFKSLAEINDEGRMEFEDIADFMETYPSLIFKEPK